MSFFRDQPVAEYSRMSRSRSPFWCGRGYPRSRSREPNLERFSRERSPVSRDPRAPRSRSREFSLERFTRGRRAEHRRVAGQVYDEYRRSPGQHVGSQCRRDASPGCVAFSSFKERGFSHRRDRNEFVNRHYNCTIAGNEWTGRCEMKWPPRRNRNGIGKTDDFSSTNTAENSNAPPFPVICSFYNSKTTCGKGDSCKFIHLCKYFIEDNCKYRKLCKRSHNIFDRQPRRLLQKYDLIPDDNQVGTNKLDIASVKEALRKVKSISSETTSPTLSRPLLDAESYLEREKSSPADTDIPSDCESEGGSKCEPINSPEGDWSDLNTSDGAEEKVEKAEDFIPLETNSKTGKDDKKDKSKKRKRRKSDKKTSKGKRKGNAIKLELVEENWNDASDTDIDLSITFEYYNPERRFLVRQIKNKWQISNIDGEWKEMSFDESEIFNKLSYKGLEIGNKALCQH